MDFIYGAGTEPVMTLENEAMETVRDMNDRSRRQNRKYYEAYDDRYRTAHALGVSWAGEVSTPIVMQTLLKYQISKERRILEIGCGEGRDARVVLESGCDLLATDVSDEAIAYCKKQMPQYANCFSVMDCLADRLDASFDFIYAVAVIHMLVPDADRNGFYHFIREHLTPEGIALICTMGDGQIESRSDISTAFTLQERDHESGRMMVAGTSCRMVSFQTFEQELARSGLRCIEKGITASPPDFNSLMYAVVSR